MGYKPLESKTERATGNKEDPKSINYFLDSLSTRISNNRTELINNDQTITSQKLIDFVKGKNVSKVKVLEDLPHSCFNILKIVSDEYFLIKIR